MSIEGVQILSIKKHFDSRGYFSNLWSGNKDFLSSNFEFLKQVNVSMNVQAGTIRGLHYQISPHDESKLVICLKGEILDVLTDVRPASPTFGKSMSFELSDGFENAILIPKMVAHGFQTLVDSTFVMYLHSSSYNKTSERGINPLDKTLNLPWRLPPSIISERDLRFPSFQELVAQL